METIKFNFKSNSKLISSPNKQGIKLRKCKLK